MIVADGLTKRYGRTLAVDRLSFEVRPGQVTGFLGPNGAGKSTTMRMILGLDGPDAGRAQINGKDYHQLRWPLREVGALLEAKAFHPGRSAYHHLTSLAVTNAIPLARVDEVLETVGLSGVARKRAGTFSLGMGQRLGMASALLGDPGVLMFDEPVNGLDPEGIRWIRNFLKALARQGRTVLVSSHLMSEMALTADHLVVIGRGRMITEMSVAEFIAQSSQHSVRVRSPQAGVLSGILSEAGATVTTEADGGLVVTGLSTSAIGELAGGRGVILHELSPQAASLEEAFMEMTHDSVEYRGGGGMADSDGRQADMAKKGSTP